VACQYTELTSRIRSIAEQLRDLKFKSTTLEEGEHDVSDEIEVNTLLINELTTLAMFHKEQLDYSANVDNDINIIAKEHYDRALGSLLACEYYHVTTWKLLKEEHIHPDPQDDNLPPFVYERHAITLGAFGVALYLSDLYDAYYVIYNNPAMDGHQEWNEEQSNDLMREGYSSSYRYLLSCEYWCIESQRLLDSIDLDRTAKYSSSGHERQEQIYKEQMKRQHQLHVHTTQQSCASANVRLGTLLLTMYAAGFTLNSEEMLSYNPFAQTILLQDSGYALNDETDGQLSEQIVNSIKSDQQRLLHSVVEKIQTSVEMFNGMESSKSNDFNNDDYGDNRINLADSHHHLGVARQYLGDYAAAISEWRTSLLLYRELFDEYKSSEDIDVVALLEDVVQSLVTTSQQCGDALLTLGHYDEAKEMYRLNLKLRQWSDGAALNDELRDENHYEEWNNPQYYGDLPAYATKNIDDSINEHKAMLDEYYKNLMNNPDGSYHEVTFDEDGSQASSVATSDKIYEGSLRSVIGSLYLAKNNVREARDELELAVGLLRKGIRDEEAGIFDSPARDINGNEMSLPLYLADALLNLSYAQAGMRQWQASMTSFEDALDIYSKELPEGEAPFDHKKQNAARSRDPAQQRDGMLEKLRKKLTIQVENYNLNRNNSTENDMDDEL
jgi:hypothetical protein